MNSTSVASTAPSTKSALLMSENAIVHRGLRLQLVPRADFGLEKIAPGDELGELKLAQPPEYGARDWAVFLLQSAAEVEHALMVQYLFVLYSLRTDLKGDDAALVVGWSDVIARVAKEEMGHLMTVQNLLRLIGGQVTFERQDFPLRSGYYPFKFALERFSKNAIAKYIFAEMSAGEIPEEIITQKERDEITERAKLAVGSGSGAFLNHVGALYATIADVFAIGLTDSDFRTDRDDWQMNVPSRPWTGTNRRPGDLRDTKVLPVTTRAAASAAIHNIAQQGEVANNTISHFNRFLAIYRACPEDASRFVWPVCTNPVTSHDQTEGTLIDEAPSALWARLGNHRYRMLLAYLLHVTSIPGTLMFTNSTTGEQISPFANLQQWIYEDMIQGSASIKNLAMHLATIPVPNDRGETCGLPFELPYSLELPGLEPERWRLHRDLLESSIRLCTELRSSITGDDQMLVFFEESDAARLPMLLALESSASLSLSPKAT